MTTRREQLADNETATQILLRMKLGEWQARWSVSNRQLAELWGTTEGHIRSLRSGNIARATAHAMVMRADQLGDLTVRMERLLQRQSVNDAYRRAICAETVITIRMRLMRKASSSMEPMS